MTNNNQTLIPQDYDALFKLIQSANETNFTAVQEQSAEQLAGMDYALTTGLPQTLTDDNEKMLAGRFLWEDGERSTGLDEFTQKQGVMLDSLDAIQANAPEVFKKLKYWQESLKPDSFESLISSLAKETLVLYVPKFAVVSKELLLDLVLSEAKRSALVRIWVYLEDGAQAVFTVNLRSRKAQADNFYSGCLQVYVGDGAHLILNEVQDFHQKVYVAASKSITAGRVSNVQWNTCELGGIRLKNEAFINLKGEGSNALVYGLYFGSKNQKMELNTRQNHLASNTTSFLHFKGAVTDEAYANWQGMVYVDPVAQRSDGYQKNENLMLSPDAHVFSKPGLEIITDDVKCSHGTTISEIDSDQIFYLESRGIPEKEAKLLILQGYFDTVLNNITYDPIREKLKEKIYLKMDR